MMPGTERAAIGLVIVCVSVALLGLLLVWALLPSPPRAETALPSDREGYSYRCYCWRDPVTVTIRTEQGRRRHARDDRATFRDRIRSLSSPNVGAECGPGAHPEPVAA